MRPIPPSQLAPVQHLHADIFLLGIVAGLSVTAVLFFLRFWRDTRDVLFIGFAAFFLIQAITSTVDLALAHPNWGSPSLFFLRFVSVLILLAVILGKNSSRR